MRRCLSVLGGVVGLAAMSIFMVGCGGGGGDDATPSATGTWGFVDPSGAQETMTLAESGETISGTTTRGATVTGTRQGSNANIDLHYANNYTVTVVVKIDGDTMTGTVTDSNGGSGTVVIVRIDTDGDFTPGLYSGTETLTITISGTSVTAGTFPFMLQVDDNGQVMLPGADITTSVGGISAHTMISHTQTGNSFTLTAAVDMGGYGSLSYTYSGTITGNLISGTISGSGPSGMVISGSFQATKQ